MLKTGVTVVVWRGLFHRTTGNSLAPLRAQRSTPSTLIPDSTTRWRHESFRYLRSRRFTSSLSRLPPGNFTRKRPSDRPYSTSTSTSILTPDVEAPRSATKLLREHVDVPAELLLLMKSEHLPPSIRRAVEDLEQIQDDGTVRVNTEDIVAFLRYLRDARPGNARVPEFWAEVLEPYVASFDPLIYDPILRAQARHEGSCEAVSRILTDAEEAGYNLTSESLHHVLRALATHPDYILRNRVLDNMKARYIELTPDGHVSVLLGLLRDGQHELAMDRLEQVVQDNIEVPTWVYDVFLFVFAELGFHDEVIRIVSHHRLNRQETGLEWPSANTLYFLLDKCSQAYHYDSTKFIWNLAVPKMVNPPDGMLENVVNTAVKGIDPVLASQVIRMLASRGNKLALHHYEPLIACYAGAGEPVKALNVLCIMHRAGVKSEPGSTRSLYLILRTQEPHELTETARMLFRLKSQGPVPISAFNVVLEAMLEKNGLAQAMDFYKRVRSIVNSGPDVDTFNTILRMIHMERPQRSLETVEFLMAEMRTIGILPDRFTYEHVIHNLVRADQLQASLQYLRDMSRTFSRSMGRTGWVTKVNALFIIRRLLEAGLTEEAELLIAESNARGLKIKDVHDDLSKLGLRAGGTGGVPWAWNSDDAYPPEPASATPQKKVARKR